MHNACIIYVNKRQKYQSIFNSVNGGFFFSKYMYNVRYEFFCQFFLPKWILTLYLINLRYIKNVQYINATFFTIIRIYFSFEEKDFLIEFIMLKARNYR